MEGDLKSVTACPVSRFPQGQCTLTNCYIHYFFPKNGPYSLEFFFALLIIFYIFYALGKIKVIFLKIRHNPSLGSVVIAVVAASDTFCLFCLVIFLNHFIFV